MRQITAGLAQPERFIEGVTWLGQRWVASTYMDKVALEYDQNLNLVSTKPFPWEGWGLTHNADGSSLVATNGSSYIMFLDPQTFAITDSKAVMCVGKQVGGVNELEMVPNFMGQGPRLLGNVINTRVVVVLDPATGVCTGTFHLRDLEPVQADEMSGYHVANGIAYNPKTGTFIVTGKKWNSMYEIELKEGPGVGESAADELRRSYMFAMLQTGAVPAPQH